MNSNNNNNKKRGNFKLQTIEKYTDVLKTTIEAVINGEYKAKAFSIKHGVPSDFSMAIVRLGFIEKKGEKANSVYSTKLRITDIEPKDGRTVLEEIARIREERAEVLNQPAFKPLNKLTDQELIDELKKRGYTGELSKKISL